MLEDTFESAAGRLAGAIGRSVEASVKGFGRVAVAFSGGVDSSILVVAAIPHTEVVACSAFAPGALDAERAEAAAKILGVKLVSTRLTSRLAENELKSMALPFVPTLMDRSLWCLYAVVARSAAGAGSGEMLLGQLSDELFGGYAKYQFALEHEGRGAAEKMMTADVSKFGSRGRVRDYDACSRWVEAKFPFEADEVVEIGEALPMDFKIRNGVRKAVLRRAALLLGVPEELANLPKKAAQYSSGVQKLLR